MPSAVDVLILIALPEEARVFHQQGFHPLKEEPDLQSFSNFSFEFLDDSGQERTGRLVVAGEIGSRIRDAALLFAQEFLPKFVLNIGISGLIKDPKVGDVVVPSHLNVIDYRSAAQDDGQGGYTFLAGGKPTPISSIASAIVNAVPFSDGNKMPTIFVFAKTTATKLSESEIAKLKAWQAEGTLASKPAIVSGPFAVSNMLMKSDRFKESVLKRADRNYVAADMESGLIADGLQALSVPPHFYAIRAISDPASPEKSEYDAIGRGLIRQWAMANARQIVLALLRHPKLFGSEQASLAKANIILSGDYSPEYPGQRIVESADVSAFDDRFANLEFNSVSSKRVPPDAGTIKFSDFVDAVRKSPRNGRFLVRGRGGGGKSAVLKTTELLIKQGPSPCDTIFLNVRKVCAAAKISSSVQAQLLQRIKRDTINLLGTDRSVVVFLDELYGHDDEPPVLDALQDLLERNEPIFVLAFGQDHYELISAASGSREPYIGGWSFDLAVDLKAISINDDARALSVISGIVRTSGIESKLTSVEVLKALKQLGFPYLNHFVVSTYLDNFEKLGFARLQKSTHFLLQSMQYLHQDVYGRSKEPVFDLLCVEALRAYCRDLSKPTRRTEPKRTPIQVQYSESFAHFPRIVQTALIAQAITYILTEFDKVGVPAFKGFGIDEKSFLSLVFSNDVNKCVKDLLGDQKIEAHVLRAAKKILQRRDPPGLSYALYLFGRAQSVQGRREAAAAFDASAPLLGISNQPTDEQSRKFWRLARRSLQISRSMNGDRAATDTYISDVLSDPYEDSLNRSFHLEYYRDHQGTGMTVELELEDKGGGWSRTRQVLRQKLHDALRGGVGTEYDRICILTYFSLVRFRHEKGSLSASVRKSELTFIAEVLAGDVTLGDHLKAFLIMVQNALSKPIYTSIDAIVELYALKAMPRAGWVKRNLAQNSDVIETVGSHVFGTMLLAELLCECIVPQVSEDERRTVLQLLIYHDLAEAYIGDYTPTDGEAKSKEAPAIDRISTLSTFRYLPRLAVARTQWKEFETGNSPCALLARDFDKLDAVFQAFVYADRFPNFENRKEFLRSCRDMIGTPSLREIADEVLVRASAVEATDQLRNM